MVSMLLKVLVALVLIVGSVNALFCDCCDRQKSRTLELAHSQSACLRSCMGVGTPEFENACVVRCFSEGSEDMKRERECCSSRCAKPLSFLQDIYASCCHIHELAISGFPEVYVTACEVCKQVTFQPMEREQVCCEKCGEDEAGCCNQCGWAYSGKLDHSLRCCTYCASKFTSGSQKEAQCCESCLSWM